jgi:predicted signal transduction protein with EAL and GGDEF domain
VKFGDQKIPVSFSVGWTDYRSGDVTEDLFHRADEALYRDKETRKQSVPVASK